MKRSDAEQLLADLQPQRPNFANARETLVDDLEAQIEESSRWCAIRIVEGGPDADLSEPDLAPRPLEKNRWNALHDVGALRRALLPRDQTVPQPQPGRFLVYFPDADLCDGAAAVASEEFFDDYNCPPFGTWVGYFDDATDEADTDPNYSGYVLCWVPERFKDLANAGVNANPEACIRWLDETTVRIRPVLQALELASVRAPL
ncbi:MAG: hypothetical protein ACRBN8_19055 [Nannocystales bacterium]